MTSRAVSWALIFGFAVPAVGMSRSKLSEIPDGSLSDNTYTNEALGVKFHVPNGWTANTDGEIPAGFDYHPRKDPSRQCIKVLMSISAPGGSKHPEYKSRGTYFALDPGCFPDERFPRALDPGKIRDLAGEIIHGFAHSPYISPDGADIGAFQQENLLFLMLTGQSHAGISQDAVHENMMLSLTEFNGYWIGWATRADDVRTEQLKNAGNGLQFWIGPKGKMP